MGRTREKGFTLAEIMIVLAILGLLMGAAIPNLLRSRVNAGEVAAINNCRTIGTGCSLFYTQSHPHAYPEILGDLTSAAPPYLDSVLGSGEKQGYRFFYSRLDSEHFELRAHPTSPGRSGNRFFFLDQTGVLRVGASASVGPADPAVE